MSIHLDNEVQKVIDSMTLSHHPEQLEYILKCHKLQEYYKEFEKWNDSKLTYSVYHDKKHCISVALNCYEGAMHSPGLSNDDIKALLLAGLFHDVKHSQGSLYHSDKVNIDNAIEAFTGSHAIVKNKINDSALNKVISLIKITEYPYKRSSNVADLASKIIRDADLMNHYDPSEQSLQAQIGLFNEIYQRESYISISESAYSFSRFIENNEIFLRNIKWNTRWAKLKSIVRNEPLIIKNNIKSLKSIYL